MNRLHPGHQLGTVQGDIEEELQSRDGRIQRHRRDAVIDKVQLKAGKWMKPQDAMPVKAEWMDVYDRD